MESGLEPEESLFSDFSENQGDTSDLIRIYKENTLEVSLKYPSGWMYKDQNVEDMLDGITFLTTTAGYITALCSHRSSRKKYLESPKVLAQI